MTLDLDSLAVRLKEDPRVVLATIFGSSQEGLVRDGGDVDIAVLLSPPPTPLEFYAFYHTLVERLSEIADLDLVDLHHAGSVLAFEALCGRRLVVRDDEAVAAFASETARQYEDDMFHASHRSAA